MAILVRTDDALRTPVLDVTIGPQNGILQSPSQWVSLAPYVRQQLMAVLVTPPALMNYMPNSKFQLAALKALIELMPQKIDGLQSTISNDFDGPVVGNAGEKLEAPIKSSRTPSTPTFEWAEKYGQAITRFWTELSRLVVMDPDLTVPGIVASPAYIQAGSPPILPDQQAMTVLFFEPDITMTHVTNAWLCANMMPRSGGEIIGRKEKGGSNETPVVSIEFTAFTQTGLAPAILAKNYLSTLRLEDLRPLDLKGFTDHISPDVDTAAIQQGLATQVSEAVLPVGG